MKRPSLAPKLRKLPLGRGGKKHRPPIPVRTCLASGQKLTQPEMLRFVLSPEDVVTPDMDRKLPGRGYWIKSGRAELERACARNLFARSARRQVQVPDDLFEQVESSLVRRISNLLSLARKSGEVVAGYERVLEELRKGSVGLLLQASDGSPRQAGKLAGRARRVENSHCLTATELGIALRRQKVIHAAVKAGGLSERVRVESRRLSGVRNCLGATD